MKYREQAPVNAGTAQSASVDIPSQDQLSGAEGPRELINVNNMNRSDMFQKCSIEEQTCTTAEMSTVAEDLSDEESTNKYCCAQGAIPPPDLSTTNIPPSILDHSEAIATVTDRTGNAVAPDENSSLMTDVKPTNSRLILGGFHSSRENDNAELPDFNRHGRLMSRLGALGDNDNPRLATSLLELSASLLAQAHVLGSVSDIHHAIDCLTTAARISRGDHVIQTQVLRTLAIAYDMKFKRYRRVGDLDSAIEYQQQTIGCARDKHDTYAILIAELGGFLYSRYKVSGSLDDIHRAIEHQTHALSFISETDNNLAGLFNNLGVSYMSRFERLDELEDISKAIECQAQAVHLAPEQSPDIPNRLNNLGNSYTRRFERLGVLEDINKAIDCQTRGAQLTPEGHLATPSILNNLGNSYIRRFERLYVLEDIGNAIDCHTRAVQLTPEGHLDMPNLLNSLGTSYKRRFERLNELEDICKAIDCHTRAAQLTPEEHPDLHARLNNLGISYRCRFERLGELEDIIKGIDCQTRAVQSTPEGHPDMPSQLNSLSTSYLRRFERLDELEDIGKAINCQTQAVQLTPEGHPGLNARCNNLGVLYLSRFKRLGELEDNSKAIDCHTRAVQLTPETHLDMHSQLTNLGSSYVSRFERLGELEDISKAIEYHTRAVQLTPKEHTHMPSKWNSLGGSYRSRFKHLGELEDSNKAIDCHTRAVQLTPEGHPAMPSWWSNLGNSYSDRFERLDELKDISKAIDCHTRAVELTPEGHPELPTRQSHLGISYGLRFGCLSELEDISKAIACQTQALQLTPEGHSGIPSRCNNLACSYLCRYWRLGEPEDIKRAIEVNEQTLHVLPQVHMLTSTIRRVIAASYHTRFIHFRNPQDMMTALEYYETAACTSLGAPNVRLMASRDWAGLLSVSDHSASLPAHRITMQLLPEVIWLGMTSARRYESITEIGAVAVEAAAAAISAEQYSLALEWLEEGRSIVWNQTLQLRTPFDALAIVDSVLTQDLQQVAKQLEIANRRTSDVTPMGVDTIPLEQTAIQHHRLVEQYNQLVSQARGLPDFHDFMRPKRAAVLMPAARSGPVVVVNVHAQRCDALILLPESDQTAHLPLPDLSEARVVHLNGLMRNALAQSEIRERKFLKPTNQPRGRYEDILIALWYRLVKPVLDFLGYTSKVQADQLPRVTWCTTGALSFLPIHAAGNYGSGPERVFDYAITSYTPTLSALLTTTPQSSIQMSGVLAVSQESTPGLSSLPGTKDELNRIKKHLEGLYYEQLENSQATPQAVLDAMEKYGCVHLACHASQNVETPTQSCFHLHNGTLSLDDIAQRSLKNKSLAFLSACQTATGDQKMPDEAIHLAAGMLVAGYPSVIATMWSISDNDAPSVADEVYGQLVRDGKLDCSEVARALHMAVGALRAKVGEDAFSRWVPYIYMGV